MQTSPTPSNECSARLGTKYHCPEAPALSPFQHFLIYSHSPHQVHVQPLIHSSSPPCHSITTIIITITIHQITLLENKADDHRFPLILQCTSVYDFWTNHPSTGKYWENFSQLTMGSVSMTGRLASYWPLQAFACRQASLWTFSTPKTLGHIFDSSPIFVELPMLEITVDFLLQKFSEVNFIMNLHMINERKNLLLLVCFFTALGSHL